MGSKQGLNVETLVFPITLAGLTNSAAVLLCALDKDYMEVMYLTVAHTAVGVGAQNIAYFLKTSPGQTNTPFTTVSTTTGNLPNATAFGSSAALGNGLNQTALAEGRNLFLDVAFAAGVTSGAVITVTVQLRK